MSAIVSQLQTDVAESTYLWDNDTEYLTSMSIYDLSIEY